MKPIEAVGIAVAGIGSFIGGIILSCYFKPCVKGQGGRGDITFTIAQGMFSDVIMSILPPKLKGDINLVDAQGKIVQSMRFNIAQGSSSTTDTFRDVPYGAYSVQWHEENNGWSGSTPVVHSSPVTFVSVPLMNNLNVPWPRYSAIQNV